MLCVSECLCLCVCVSACMYAFLSACSKSWMEWVSVERRDGAPTRTSTRQRYSCQYNRLEVNTMCLVDASSPSDFTPMPFYGTTSSALVNGQSPHHTDKCTRNVVVSVFHHACAPAPTSTDDSGTGTRFLSCHWRPNAKNVRK